MQVSAPAHFSYTARNYLCDCLHWAVNREAETNILAKSFPGYCRGTAAARSEWPTVPRYATLRTFSARPSIHAPSGRSLCGSARPPVWTSAVTLTTIVTAWHWNGVRALLSCKTTFMSIVVLLLEQDSFIINDVYFNPGLQSYYVSFFCNRGSVTLLF
jgi:hypothetical protein